MVKDTDEAAMKGLQAVGLEMVAEAKMNLKRNRTTNTGALSASGKVQKADDGEGVDAGFFSEQSQHGYAAAVEYGRGPTQQPSEDGISLRQSLRAWVRRKLNLQGKELENATFLIARKIHREGTKPQPFFTPAVEKVKEKTDEIMSKYINEAIQ